MGVSFGEGIGGVSSIILINRLGGGVKISLFFYAFDVYVYLERTGGEYCSRWGDKDSLAMYFSV